MKKNLWIKTSTQVIIATILLVSVVGLGIIGGVLNIIEAIIGGVLILILIPFLLKFLHLVPRHDDKFRDVDRGENKS